MQDICVKIDLDALCLRLTRKRGRAIGKNEAHAWLHGVGFRMSGADAWFCDGEQTRHLEPAEMIRLTRTVKDGAMTFVEHEEPPK